MKRDELLSRLYGLKASQPLLKAEKEIIDACIEHLSFEHMPVKEKDDTGLWIAGYEVCYRNATQKLKRFCKYCHAQYDTDTREWKKVCDRYSEKYSATEEIGKWEECTCQCLGEEVIK